MSSRHHQVSATNRYSSRLNAYLGVVLATTVIACTNPAQAQNIDANVSINSNMSDNQEQYLIYVNPSQGQDQTADGTKQAPFKTISQALTIALPNSVIALEPGTYSTQSGEIFPIIINNAVSIVGNRETKGQGVIIEGGGIVGEQNVTILARDRATGIEGVTIINPNPQGYGLWIEANNLQVTSNTFTNIKTAGIAINGNSRPTITNNYFYNNYGNGLIISDQAQPQIKQNVIAQTGFGISLMGDSRSQLIANQIIGSRVGIMAEGNAQATLRQNLIENSQQDGLIATSNSKIDLGTSAEPGNNIFRHNSEHDVQNLVNNYTISAVGNQIGGNVNGNINLSGNPSLSAPQVSTQPQLTTIPLNSQNSHSAVIASTNTYSDQKNWTSTGENGNITPSLPSIPETTKPIATQTTPVASNNTTSLPSFTPIPETTKPVATQTTPVASNNTASLPTVTPIPETTKPVATPTNPVSSNNTASLPSVPSIPEATKPVATQTKPVSSNNAASLPTVTPISETQKPVATQTNSLSYISTNSSETQAKPSYKPSPSNSNNQPNTSYPSVYASQPIEIAVPSPENWQPVADPLFGSPIPNNPVRNNSRNNSSNSRSLSDVLRVKPALLPNLEEFENSNY